MDFFEHQEAARRSSRRLVILFALAVGAILLLVAGLSVLGTVLVVSSRHPGDSGAFMTAESLRRLPLGRVAGLSAVITLGVIACGSFFKTMQLSGGGRSVAKSVGARRVETDTTDSYERRLLNVVEEMALAAGCPVPAVYLMENEDGVNAFAAGWSLDDAVIGVTHGAMRQLSRDELQGVVAHEFSHILHGDMRLNLRLTGLVFGILAISVLGAMVMRAVGEGMSHTRYHRRDRSEDGGAMAMVVAAFVVGAALYAVGSLGVFFARLIQAAMSRQREFLADASAVQYTRNPDGIGNALRRIGGLAEGSRLRTAHAMEHSHLFFGASSRGGLTSALATHPPLASRITRLMPHWDGLYLGPRRRGVPSEEAVSHAKRNEKRAAGHPAMMGLAGVSADAALKERDVAVTREMEMGDAVVSIGAPTPAHLARARALIEGLPSLLRQAVRTPAGAQAVLFALLCDPVRPQVVEIQWETLGRHVDLSLAELAERLAPEVSRLDPASRLPLLDLTLPALAELHPRARRSFEAGVDALIAADGRLGLFEWALRQALWRHLIGPAAARTPRRRRLAHHHEDLVVLLAVLARVDPSPEHSKDAAEKAFAAGAAYVTGFSSSLPAANQVSMARLTQAVDRLGMLRPLDTRQVIHACAAVVAADHTVTVREVELLRAVAETLDVPMPPLLPGQRLI
ncbi:MAG: M48 family metallopeptidase [Algisphaera sp.]